MLRLLAAGAMLAASPSIYMMFHSHAEAYVRKGTETRFAFILGLLVWQTFLSFAMLLAALWSSTAC
jgi:hypothetical protein